MSKRHKLWEVLDEKGKNSSQPKEENKGLDYVIDSVCFLVFAIGIINIMVN